MRLSLELSRFCGGSCFSHCFGSATRGGFEHVIGLRRGHEGLPLALAKHIERALRFEQSFRGAGRANLLCAPCGSSGARHSEGFGLLFQARGHPLSRLFRFIESG